MPPRFVLPMEVSQPVASIFVLSGRDSRGQAASPSPALADPSTDGWGLAGRVKLSSRNDVISARRYSTIVVPEKPELTFAGGQRVSTRV